MINYYTKLITIFSAENFKTDYSSHPPIIGAWDIDDRPTTDSDYDCSLFAGNFRRRTKSVVTIGHTVQLLP